MPSIIRYALDPTGLNADNFVAGEVHTLQNFPLRAIVTSYGAFFTDSLKVTDRGTNTLLTRGTHYICTELATTPTELYGKEIAYLVIITDPTVSSNVSLDYQALGGLYGRSTEAILSVYDAFLNSVSNTSWPAILNKPSEFNPTMHLHDIGDVYGFEYIVNALERLREAILIGATPVFQNILAYVDEQVVTMTNTTRAAQDVLDNHAGSQENPHGTTKAQIGLGNVPNLRPGNSTDMNKVISNVATITDDAFVTVANLLFFNKNNTSANGDTLNAAKAYADSKDTNVLQTAYSADSTNLAAAKAYADAKDTTVAATARSYTDSAVTATLTAAANAAKSLGHTFNKTGGFGLTGSRIALVKADAGCWAEIQLDGMTVTLPDITLSEVGDTYTITCLAASAIVKTFNGTQQVSGSRSTTFKVFRDETFTIVSNGPSGYWYVVSCGTPSWNNVPIGGIISFDGFLTDLPANWKVCDGTNGTPNLTNRFIVGVGRFAKGAVGGTADGQVVAHTHGATSTFAGNPLGAHAHGVNDGGHNHYLETPVRMSDVDRGGQGSLFSLDTSTNTYTSASTSNISIQASAAGTPSGTVSTSITSTGVGATDINLPPYYSLYYIKRIA